MEVKTKHTGLISAGLLIGIFVTALDGNIMSTAMPVVATELNGFEYYTWVTTCFITAQMATMPIVGKLADIYGRKLIFLACLVTFLFGSLLCGIATSMPQLIVFRTLQGIGAGFFPIAFTIMYDIYNMEKVNKMSGLFSAVFGTSSVIGPVIGGFITQNLNWHWIFFINLPIGIISIAMVFLYYHENRHKHKTKIDFAGAITFVTAIVCFMFALQLNITWLAIPSFICFALFIFIEMKISYPIISLKLFKIRAYFLGNLLSFLYCVAFIVFAVYLPVYLQKVMGENPQTAGIILISFSIMSSVSAAVGGIMANRFSYKKIILFSGTLLVIGNLFYLAISPSMSSVVMVLLNAFYGFALGFQWSILNLVVISRVDPANRGEANSTLGFIRSFGNVVGISVYGIIFQTLLMGQIKKSGVIDAIDINSVMAGTTSPQFQEFISRALISTFIINLVPTVLIVVCALFMNKNNHEGARP